MDATFISVLTDGIREYYGDEELIDLCAAFGVELECDPQRGIPKHQRLAINLITKLEHGNNHRLLTGLVPSLVNRASEGVAHNDWERRDYHSGMRSRLERLADALPSMGLPEEISVPENLPFTAKSQVRELLCSAETPVTVVDVYIGAGTLDCMRDVKHPIRLLTGDKAQSVETGFERALTDFRTEGRSIEVRQHSKLHDRYIAFNDRCWLVGSSLKDAGKKSFNLIEFVDGKVAILAEIESKWGGARVYAPALP